MANSVFLDTNGWLAILNSDESSHSHAYQVWQNLIRRRHPVVLTDWVLAETGNGMARFKSKDRLEIALNRILANPRCEFVVLDQLIIRQAVEFFVRHTDKSWGLVDCASFVVMHERGITEAFTSGVHFEQAGFKRLLSA
jgi:uncharacterized protein